MDYFRKQLATRVNKIIDPPPARASSARSTTTSSSSSSTNPGLSSIAGRRGRSQITPALHFDPGTYAQSSPRQQSDLPWHCEYCNIRNEPSNSVLKRCSECNKKATITFVSTASLPTPSSRLLESPSQSGLRAPTPRVPSFPVAEMNYRAPSNQKAMQPPHSQQSRGQLGSLTSPNLVRPRGRVYSSSSSGSSSGRSGGSSG